MKRILITGAAGFVGANLTRRMLADGHEVHVTVRGTRPGWRLSSVQTDIRAHTVDLSDSAGVREIVSSVRPDWVLHCAAYGAYSRETDLCRMIGTNITGAANLIHACLEQGVEALVSTGSSSEYGFKPHAPREDEIIEPNSAYAVTKAFGTQYAQFVARQHGLHAVTLRLYSVYGPFEDEQRLVPTLLTAALAGRLPPLVSPDAARDFVYVDDVCEAIVRAAACSSLPRGSVFSVGTERQTTLRETVALVCQLFNVTEEPRWGSMPPRPWDTSTWAADCARIRAALNWAPTVTLSDGLKRTAEWIGQGGYRSPGVS